MMSARGRETAVAAVAFAVLTVVFSWPLILHPASTVLSDSPDTHLFMWTLAWDTHALLRAPFAMFEANIYFPQHTTLAYSENLIGTALFAAPVLWVSGNPVLALNLVSLLSALLSALGAFVLARRIGASPLAAAMAGLIYGFTPARFLRLDQLHLTTLQWIPWCLAALHAYLDEPRPLWLRLAVACFTLQVLSSGHGAVFVGLAVLGLLAYRLACGDPLAPLQRLRDLGVTGMLLLLPSALLFLPYLRVQREVGLRRSLENWAIAPASFLASPAHLHARILGWLHLGWVNDAAEAYLFPGWVPLALTLALVALLPWTLSRRDAGPGLRERLRSNAAPFYLLLTLVAVWLSVGASWSLWPRVYWMPGLNFVRVPARFMLLAILGIAVLAALGFDRVSRPWRAGLRLAVGTLLLLTMCGEFAAMPLGVDPFTVEIPAIDRWLATERGRFAIAEVPLSDPRSLGRWERRHTLYMLHAMAHWHPTVEGYSGFRTPLHEQLYDLLTRFPDDASVAKLMELGVSRVVVHSDYYDTEGQWLEVRARLERTASLQLEHQEGDGYVYRVLKR